MRGFSAPYFNLYLDDMGFSATLIGSVLSVASVIELILIPTFSKIADITGSHRLMYRGLILAYILAAFAMILYPVTAVLFVGTVIVQANLRSTFIFAMQLSFTKLEQHGKTFFGRIRSTSSFGFMLGNFIATLIFSIWQFVGLYTATIISGALSIGLSNAMPKSTTDKPSTSIDNETAAETATRNRKIYPVFLAQFFVAIGLRNGFAFWLIYFQDALGISTEQIAIIVTVSSIMELPGFMLLDKPLKKWGAVWFYIIGVIGLGAHYLLYGFLSSFLGVLAILVIRGPMFAMWNLSILVHVNEISHPKNVSTNQALAQITIPSIAGLISSAPLGFVYDNYSPMLFFTLCFITLTIGGIIMLVSQLNERKLKTV
jgi:PPP family 3-phenylpropionic acid transporter